MRKIWTGVVFAGVAMMGFAAQAKPGAATIAAGDMKWTDVPGMTGIHLAVADGNPQKGPSHFFIKFDKGVAAPEHHHSADHYVTVLAGTLILGIDGKDVSLPAGSYFAFTGKKVHTTRCDAAADCLLSVDARGKWDVVPEKKPEEGKK